MLKELQLGWLALKELGIRQVGLYALYRFGLVTGHYRRSTPIKLHSILPEWINFRPVFDIPPQGQLAEIVGDSRSEILREAEELVHGQIRLFGGVVRPLLLTPPGSDKHWTKYKSPPGEDIKLIWEPARFGWAFTLGRAYLLTQDERYPQVFWQYWEQFTAGNPVNCGPNWESGQEVALRLIAYCFAAQVFAGSEKSTPQRKASLLAAIADHVERIPPTLVYARAQHNNHLISEACGLYLAGTALKGHPQAEKWRNLGWKWLNQAFMKQIEPDGTYAQHSMNYHRMMLHLALLASRGARINQQKFSSTVAKRLADATTWLLAQIDPVSGNAPNLGHNDGANILPFGATDFRDHRPVGQAAGAEFLDQRLFSAGKWDELSAWLDIKIPDSVPIPFPIESQGVKRLGNGTEWGTLRAVHFHTRPAHADQLHVDLWSNGKNMLMDPGTVAYSQSPQFINSQVYTRFHNTISIDHKDPMLRAGKFLWLRWDQARWVKEETLPGVHLTAEHDGYLRQGVLHKRCLHWKGSGNWEVKDWVTPTDRKIHTLTLQWMLPDGRYSLTDNILSIVTKTETLTIEIQLEGHPKRNTQDVKLVRGGKLERGIIGNYPEEGWYSPTYLQILPVYSFQVTYSFDQAVWVKSTIRITAANPE